MLAIVATGCAFDPGQRGRQVIGTWALDGLSVDGVASPIAADLAETSVTFLPGGRFQGQAPCNDFAGLWSHSGKGLGISGLVLSAVACVDPDGGRSIMEAEHAILDALFNSGPFSIRRKGDVLEISAMGNVLSWREIGEA